MLIQFNTVNITVLGSLPVLPDIVERITEYYINKRI